MATPRQQEEIDAALDAALDELVDEDEVEDSQETSKATKDTTTKTASDTKKISNGSLDSNREAPKEPTTAPMMGPAPPPPSIGENDDPEKLLASMMQDLLRADRAEQRGSPDDFLGNLMQEMQTQMKTELQKETASTSKKASKSESRAKKEQKSPPSKGKEVDETISNLVEDMAKQASVADVDDDAIPDDEQEMLRNIMQGIEGIEGNFDADSMIDGMMEQLVSKELMYEPMKQVAAKFPDWLEENKDSLSQKEYDDRCKQYECFRKLVNAYETEPNNTSKFMTLMQEVQEYGQPPPEIIKEIAPGLELDGDGMPKMDGIPFGGGEEECRIM